MEIRRNISLFISGSIRPVVSSLRSGDATLLTKMHPINICQYMGLAVKVCVLKSNWRFFSVKIVKYFIPHPWPAVYFVTPPACIRYDIHVTYHVCKRVYRDVKYYQMWHHDRYPVLQYKTAKYCSTQSWYSYWNKGPIIPDDELHCNQGCLQMTKASTTLSKSTWIDLLRESSSAPVPYLTVHHFVTEMCTCMLISGTKIALWCISLMHGGICEMSVSYFNWWTWSPPRNFFVHNRSNHKSLLHVHSADYPKTSSETIQ